MRRRLALGPDGYKSERRRRRDNRHYVNLGDVVFRGCVQAMLPPPSSGGLTARGEVAYTSLRRPLSLVRHAPLLPPRPSLPALGRTASVPRAWGMARRPSADGSTPLGLSAHAIPTLPALGLGLGSEGLTQWGCYDRMEGLGLSPEGLGVRVGVGALGPSPFAGRRGRSRLLQRRVPCVYLYLESDPRGPPNPENAAGPQVFVAFLFSGIRSPKRREVSGLGQGAKRLGGLGLGSKKQVLSHFT